MPETPVEHKGRDFIAPRESEALDESRRVTDPEKARAMATASDHDRSAESWYRERQAIRERSLTPLQQYNEDFAKKSQVHGGRAERAEQLAGERHEAEKIVNQFGDSVSYENIAEYEHRRDEARRDVETLERYLGDAQNDPKRHGEAQVLEKILGRAREKRNIIDFAASELAAKRYRLDLKDGKDYYAGYTRAKKEFERRQRK